MTLKKIVKDNSIKCDNINKQCRTIENLFGISF